MEKILPIDLDPKQFAVSAMGYNKQEVNRLLGKAETRLNGLIQENFHLKGQIEQLLAEQEELKTQRSELEEHRNRVENYADDVYKSAQDQVRDLKRQVEMLKVQRQKLIDDMRDVMERHLTELLETGVTKVDFLSVDEQKPA